MNPGISVRLTINELNKTLDQIKMARRTGDECDGPRRCALREGRK